MAPVLLKLFGVRFEEFAGPARSIYPRYDRWVFITPAETTLSATGVNQVKKPAIDLTRGAETGAGSRGGHTAMGKFGARFMVGDQRTLRAAGVLR